MALTETRRPYEFLARWDPATGAFRGAHVQFIDVIERDGTQVSATPTKAFGVGEGAAFPLADILAQVQTDALAALDAAQAQVATLTADKTAADQALAAAQEQVAALTAQLAQYQSTVDENGVPTWVYRSSLHLAVYDLGKRPVIEAALAAMPGAEGERARIFYATSARFYRQHPIILALVQQGVFTSQEVDAVFVAARAYDQASAQLG